MNLFFKSCVLAGFVAIGSVLSVCAEQIFNDATFLKKTKGVKLAEDGTAYVQGRTFLRSDKFPVDTAKKYTLSLAAQVPEGQAKSMIYLGFDVFTKDGRNIPCHSVAAVNNTMTEVVADAKKGDTFLLVKNGAKFIKGSLAIVTNVKDDLSDLPNFNVAATGIDAVEQQGANWKITLKRKLLFDVPAGTRIREQRMGGYFYAGGVKNVGNTWVTMGGFAKDTSTAYSGSRWPVGTAFAKVVVLVDWTNQKVRTNLKDFSLTVE